MILTPHILAGAAIGSKTNKPRQIFILILLVLLSHYFLDAFPHYEYNVTALMNGLNLDFIVAALKVFIDFAAGTLFVIFFCRQRQNFYYILAGGLISLLPDAILFLSWQTNLPFLNYLAALNHEFHYSKNIPAPFFAGLITQITTLIIAVFILFFKPQRKNKRVQP